jgi:lambda repressor-like predicted transcriptional regulator
MHPADIKAHLTKAGHSLAAVARDLNAKAERRGEQQVTPAAVWVVVHGHSRSQRIARHISQLTGLPVGKLWPGKYPQLEPRTARGLRTVAAQQRVAVGRRTAEQAEAA